jgi:hypothetical protein
MYGASLLSLIIRSVASMGLAYSNYFEPVNEGAITVEQFTVSLTPLGVIMPLLSQHGGGRRLEALPALPQPYILPTATLHSGALVLTLINRNATQAFEQPLSLAGWPALLPSASVLTYAATGPTADSNFTEAQGAVPISGAGELTVLCPAYSVVQVRVQLK